MESKAVIKLFNQLVDVVDNEVYLGTTVFNNVYDNLIDKHSL